MSAHEVIAGFQWIKAVLSNDGELTFLAPGGVWRGLAPPGTATPFIVMSLHSGNDVTTMNAFRIMDELLYLVKAVGEASKTSIIVAAADRIDDLIGSPPTSGTTTGSAILSSSRQSPFCSDELVTGELWTNIGGLYRLQIQQIS